MITKAEHQADTQQMVTDKELQRKVRTNLENIKKPYVKNYIQEGRGGNAETGP